MVGGEKSGKDISWDLHKPLCDFWQDPAPKRKSIFMPRDWLKSTIFTKWGAIWRYLQNNNIRILIASQNELNASRFLHEIQQQLRFNERLRDLYPRLQQVDETWIKKHRWSNTYCDLPADETYSEATFTSIGVGGAAQSGHYDVVNIDDPVGDKHLGSPAEMEKIMRWHDNTKELLDNPNYMSPFGSTIQIQCTFWSSGDYGCYVKDNYPEFQWRVVPALKDVNLKDEGNIIWQQNNQVDHMESNWPDSPGDRFSTEYYKEMMADPEQQVIFWAQHMNNPHKASGLNKFDVSWIKYFRFEHQEDGLFIVCKDDDEEFLLNDIPLYGMIDPGGFAETKLSKAGSRNAILIGGQPRESIKKFVIYTWCGKLKSPQDFLNQVFSAHREWKPRAWKIETVGAQAYIYKDIIEERNRRKLSLPIYKMEPDVRKDAKDQGIQALMHPMVNGEIYLHESMRDLITEIKNYPHGLTVDLVDMLGKIYKFHWTRKKIRDIDSNQKERWLENVRAREESVTGY